ncbi:MAG TPA: DUF3540 domain-containing protein [Minicystis sp.]|nr:DUF3540 domain-containing protein [Minicystis sp.]
MSNVVRLSERPAEPRASGVEDYLGPADVVRVDGRDVDVALPGGAARRAEMALAFPYAPAVGDALLVISKGEAYYVIGVLRGAGRSVLSLPGDVELSAGGELRLAGEKGVRVEGREVELVASKLRVLAGDAVQRFTSLCQRVTDMLTVHAGQAHTLVDDASYTQAKTAAIVTEGTVSINGEEVHLG